MPSPRMTNEINCNTSRLELGHVVEDLNLFAGLEGREADVRTVGAPEGVAEGTAAT